MATFGNILLSTLYIYTHTIATAASSHADWGVVDRIRDGEAMSSHPDREQAARKTSKTSLAPLVRRGPLTVTVFNCRTFIINVIVDVCRHDRCRVFLLCDILTVRSIRRILYTVFAFQFRWCKIVWTSVHSVCVCVFNMDFSGCCISLTICHFFFAPCLSPCSVPWVSLFVSIYNICYSSSVSELECVKAKSG